MNEAQKSGSNVKYYPPSAEAIEKYARDVCKHIEAKDAQEKGEIISGFTGFMKTVVRIKTKHMNRHLDFNPDEEKNNE